MPILFHPQMFHPQPYANFAQLYDAIYEAEFGNLYSAFTNQTLLAIRQMCQPPASVVDFGAGTGRLSVPLAQAGYQVTAVEPCAEMLAVLDDKKGDLEITTQCRTMEQFEGRDSYDAALAVFTVLLHLTDETALRTGIQKLVGNVRPGGSVFLDIPQRAAFQNREPNKGDRFRRSVVVNPVEGQADVYDYHDSGHIVIDGERKEWTERFQIRYWSPEVVIQLLKENDILTINPIRGFQGTGSDYLHCVKRG